MCRAHLGERIAENGRRHIFAYGLALDQPLPEAVAILDGLSAKTCIGTSFKNYDPKGFFPSEVYPLLMRTLQ